MRGKDDLYLPEPAQACAKKSKILKRNVVDTE